MSDEKAEKEPKIIVDEDWKAQAQAEKEALAEIEKQKRAEAEKKLQSQPAKDTETKDPSDETKPSAGESGYAGPIPEANLSTLVVTLATQAMATLGQIPNPETGKAETNLELAKHFIDTLVVLEEKTKGNCTPDETQMFSGTLHQLRMAYVAAQNQKPAKEK